MFEFQITTPECLPNIFLFTTWTGWRELLPPPYTHIWITRTKEGKEEKNSLFICNNSWVVMVFFSFVRQWLCAQVSEQAWGKVVWKTTSYPCSKFSFFMTLMLSNKRTSYYITCLLTFLALGILAFNICMYTPILLHEHDATWSIFNFKGFNKFEFKVFLLLDWLPYQSKKLSPPYYLPIAERKIADFIPFPRGNL